MLVRGLELTFSSLPISLILVDGGVNVGLVGRASVFAVDADGTIYDADGIVTEGERFKCGKFYPVREYPTLLAWCKKQSWKAEGFVTVLRREEEHEHYE